MLCKHKFGLHLFDVTWENKWCFGGGIGGEWLDGLLWIGYDHDGNKCHGEYIQTAGGECCESSECETIGDCGDYEEFTHWSIVVIYLSYTHSHSQMYSIQ